MDLMSDMPMGSMSMGDGAPSLFTMQKMYWAVVGSAIGAATLVNILNRLLAQHRYDHLIANTNLIYER
jgi:hypothetical protein